MPSIDNWPKELVNDLLKQAIKDGSWAKQYTQDWSLIVGKPNSFDLPEQPDAVRIHLQKDRWPRRGEHAFRDPENMNAAIVVPQEPEQPYKDDPRYGTWG
ncbi:hypothetical protein IVB12_15815 [Bradyrhizobium sp. 179]|uniref:hypothetical protein n=1 Tax=Bradyrhizobium sp. 179 TaxID=2782648 RepID=UPI001FFB7401|nr:hypothetical protein [Bradyrhizobium sp. 179]MCK1543383.1 hypothetical protein [Bradyrhizobium sp. 179]